MNQDKFIDIIEQITEKILDKKGLLTQEWHLGTIESVNGDNSLNVYIDGSSYVTPSVPCNPQYDFQTGDSVWVQYINGKQSNKFIPSRRAIGDKRSGSNNESTDKTYVHIQILPSDVWLIQHNLAKFPSVTIVDSAGTKVMGEVDYIDENTVRLRFNGTFSGRAFFN